MPPDEAPKIRWTATLRDWLSSLSRRTWILIIFGLVVILLVLAGLIVILVLYEIGKDQNNNNKSDLITSPAPPTTPPPRKQYPIGFITGTASEYQELGGNVTSLTPDYRGYAYRNRLLAYMNGSVTLIANTTYSVPMVLSDQSSCSSCRLLALDDDCIDNLICSSRAATYCCQNCTEGLNMCCTQGVCYENPSSIAEWRISTSGSQLLLATYETNVPTTPIQLLRINSSSLVTLGPSTGSFPSQSMIRTATLNVNGALAVDYVFQVVNGSLLFTNKNVTIPVELYISGPVIDIVTSVYGSHVMVSIIQQERFYAVRININNGCINLLANDYQVFLYPGTLKDGYWLDDVFLLWYIERTGINNVKFFFSWPDDSACAH